VVGKSTGGRASALATRLYATRGPCRVQAPESLPRALLASGYTDIVPEVNEEAVIAVLRALEREGVRYKVVGAVALALVGLPRATQDLDIFVAADEDNVARLRAALRSVFDDPEIAAITSADLAGDYPAVQYIPPTGAFHIDILSRLGEAFCFDDIEVEERVVEGIRIPVATPRMLFRMKRGTVRPQDRADADRLRRHFNLED